MGLMGLIRPDILNLLCISINRLLYKGLFFKKKFKASICSLDHIQVGMTGVDLNLLFGQGINVLLYGLQG